MIFDLLENAGPLNQSEIVTRARFIRVSSNRTVINPNSQFKSDQRLLIWFLRKKFKIHPSIYSISGRSYIEVLWLTIQKKSSGYFLANADIKKAFPNTQIDQLKKILRSDQVSGEYDDLLGLRKEAIKISNSKKSYRGLAQGFPASSLLHARYLSKALYRFTNKRPYEAIAVWCDDVYILAKSKRVARKSVKDLSWHLNKLDNISKIHKKNQKAPQILGPDTIWPVLGFEIGDIMISKTTDDEPIVKHESALHLLNSIKKLKALALKANDDQVIEKLEKLLPTKPIPAVNTTDKSTPWMKTGFPPYSSSSSYSHHKGQGGTLNDDQRFGSCGAAGLGRSAIFPTTQQDVLRKRFNLDSKKMTDWFTAFKSDPINESQRYIALRNELWAYFIAFYGSGSLTQLWSTNKEQIMKAYKSRDPQAVTEIRSAYIQELKMIQAGLALRFKPTDLKIPDEELKSVLRGYTTSLMILLETDRFKTLSPVCEFEIGRFRYPTLGFDTIEDFEDSFGKLRCSASEIHDLREIAEIFESGIGTLDALKYSIGRLIEKKLNASTDGIFVSGMREPVGMLYYEYFENLATKDESEELQKRMRACEETYFFNVNEFNKIREKYGLKSILSKEETCV